MKILLDTNVVSEATRPNPDPRVVNRLRSEDQNTFYISVVTIGEIVYGIHRMPESHRRRQLTSWLSDLERDFAERILPIDRDIAHTWGQISGDSEAKGVTLPEGDGLIAATAVQHDLVLMTRNVRNFQSTGLVLINPWTD